MKDKKPGFTIVELLTVLAVITLLVGLLIPSLNMVRNMARGAKQRAQFATIGQALMAFRGDDGDYPPSNDNGDYCGAQKLAEAILGWDLLGFQPSSAANSWGPNFIAYGRIDEDGVYDPDYLDERRGPYLELATADAFTLSDLWLAGTGTLAPDTFVLCDSFGVRRITVGERTVMAGTPILYYRANTSSRTIEGPLPDRIYYFGDNQALLELNRIIDGEAHPLGNPSDPLYTGLYGFFYNYITDPKAFDASGIPWPYRPDSYILISAGVDGLYGTADDITNFGN